MSWVDPSKYVYPEAVKVTLFGQRFFEDAIKLKILNEVIWIRVHPTSNDTYPERGMGWPSRRTLSSPPFTSTSKSQLTAEPPLREKTVTYQKRYSTSEDIKNKAQWQVSLKETDNKKLLWWSSSYNSVLPMQGAQIQSLVKKLRSCLPKK